MSESEDDGPGRREVAHRLFAAEFDDADLDHSESDQERAPNYVVTPTGARVNRLFVVGVLTETEDVSDEVIRARVVDPTGAFVLYAGQYQPDERAFLERADPPAFVAVTGKARTFQPGDSDRVFTSVRPESISTVDAETRDRWTVDASGATLDRVERMATALAVDATGDRLREALAERGVDEDHAAGIALAIDHYGTTPTYLEAVRTLAVEAARHVAGDLDEVAPLAVEPAAAGDVTAADLLDEPVEPLGADEPADAAEAAEPAGAPEATETPSAEATTEAAAPAGDAASAETTAGRETDPGDDALESAAEAAETDAETTEATVETTADEPADAEATASAESAGPGDFEAGEYDLDAEEREEVEEEFGTEFRSGTEVDEPGEADIETPEPDDVAADATPEPATESEPASEADEAGDEAGDAASEAADAADEAGGAPARADEESGSTDAGEVDLVDAVVAAMEDLDEGEGASRAAVVERVSEETGTDPDDVEAAVQDALMDGRCYEPDDDTLKPI